MNNLIKSILFFTLLCLFIPQSAHAYLDPGTGSIILQAIIAGALGLSFTIKIYWKKIKAFFTGNQVDGDSSNS